MQSVDKMVTSMFENLSRNSIRPCRFVVLQSFYSHFNFIKGRRVVKLRNDWKLRNKAH